MAAVMTANNPFTPPRAPVADPDENAPGSPIKAVAFGFGVDTLGTFLGGIVLSVVYGVYLVSTGTPADEVASAMSSERFSGFWWLAFLVGSGFSALGGYVCARIAKRSEYRLGSFMAVFSILLGVGMQLLQESASMDEATLNALVTWGSVIAGAYLGVQRNRHAAAGSAG
jgi:hypothetical protein